MTRQTTTTTVTAKRFIYKLKRFTNKKKESVTRSVSKKFTAHSKDENNEKDVVVVGAQLSTISERNDSTTTQAQDVVVVSSETSKNKGRMKVLNIFKQSTKHLKVNQITSKKQHPQNDNVTQQKEEQQPHGNGNTNKKKNPTSKFWKITKNTIVQKIKSHKSILNTSASASDSNIVVRTNNNFIDTSFDTAVVTPPVTPDAETPNINSSTTLLVPFVSSRRVKVIQTEEKDSVELPVEEQYESVFHEESFLEDSISSPLKQPLEEAKKLEEAAVVAVSKAVVDGNKKNKKLEVLSSLSLPSSSLHNPKELYTSVKKILSSNPKTSSDTYKDKKEDPCSSWDDIVSEDGRTQSPVPDTKKVDGNNISLHDNKPKVFTFGNYFNSKAAGTNPGGDMNPSTTIIEEEEEEQPPPPPYDSSSSQQLSGTTPITTPVASPKVTPTTIEQTTSSSSTSSSYTSDSISHHTPFIPQSQPQPASSVSIKQESVMKEEQEHENVELVLVPEDLSFSDFAITTSTNNTDIQYNDTKDYYDEYKDYDDPGDIIINTSINKLNLVDIPLIPPVLQTNYAESSITVPSSSPTSSTRKHPNNKSSRKFIKSLTKKFTSPNRSTSTTNSPSMSSSNDDKTSSVYSKNESSLASESSRTTSDCSQSYSTQYEENATITLDGENTSVSSTELVTSYHFLAAAAATIKEIEEDEGEIMMTLSEGDDIRLVRSDSQSIEISVNTPAASPSKPSDTKRVSSSNSPVTSKKFVKDELLTTTRKSSKGRKKISSKGKKKSNKSKDDHDDNSNCAWKAVMDKSTGNVYYYHTETRETKWEKPEEAFEPHDENDALQIQKRTALEKEEEGFNPVLWAKRMQLAKIIAELSPDNPEANDKLMDMYLGREDELMHQLLVLQEETPFDEPSVSASETFCNLTSTIVDSTELRNMVAITNTTSSHSSRSNNNPEEEDYNEAENIEVVDQPPLTESCPTISSSKSDESPHLLLEAKTRTGSSSGVKSSIKPKVSNKKDSKKDNKKRFSLSPAGSRASRGASSFFASLVPSAAAKGQIVSFSNTATESFQEEDGAHHPHPSTASAASSSHSSLSQTLMKNNNLHRTEDHEDEDGYHDHDDNDDTSPLPDIEPRKRTLIAEEYTGSRYELKSQQYSKAHTTSNNHNKNKRDLSPSECSDSLFTTDDELGSLLSKENKSFTYDSDLDSYHSTGLAKRLIAKALPMRANLYNKKNTSSNTNTYNKQQQQQQQVPATAIAPPKRRNNINNYRPLPNLIETQPQQKQQPPLSSSYPLQNKISAEDWTQTDIDLYISQNNWDSVIGYIAKYKNNNDNTQTSSSPFDSTTVNPHHQGLTISNTTSTLTTNHTKNNNNNAIVPKVQHQYTKTLGARSKLQHETIKQKEHYKKQQRKGSKNYNSKKKHKNDEEEEEDESLEQYYMHRRR